MDESEMVRTDWGLLYNLSENKIRGHFFSYTEDFACYIRFIEATMLEKQKDVLKRCNENFRNFRKFKKSLRKHPVCYF